MVANRKIVLVFLLAILLPALTVGYLSFSTFSKRREAVNKLLESNLYISGEAALNAIERALFDHEQEALNKENFVRLYRRLQSYQPLFNTRAILEDSTGHFFLLDGNFQFVIPRTRRKSESTFQGEDLSPESRFAKQCLFGISFWRRLNSDVSSGLRPSECARVDRRSRRL